MSNIVTHIPTREQFIKLVNSNHMGIFIQFTAGWCNPCKQIEPIINEFFKEMSGKILCCKLNIDLNTDLYNFLKRKKMINGIPCLFYYNKDNHDIPPDVIVSGGDINKVSIFLQKIKNNDFN
tara:strand:- start:430 stop:795 length:366 start_codon:yes stop_codon:yes gene_type:complete